MNERVKILRKKMNMSQVTFGMKLGVTGAGISKIESGKRKLTDQMILMICKQFNINENWLRYGDGDIFKEKHPSGMEQLAAYYQLDELDKRIICEYFTLDERKRKVIKEYILRIAYGNSNMAKAMDGGINQEVPRCAETLEHDSNIQGMQYGNNKNKQSNPPHMIQ